VKYRDFRYVLPFLLQFLFFASEVVYTISDMKHTWAKYILSVNPVNGAIELFRMGLNEKGDHTIILIGFLSALTISIFGILYFRKTEAFFADLA
jgi:lipopolysaccharide transport system permease protein